MTEYDFSPGAVRAHLEKLQKIEQWTMQVNPYTVRDANTPATPAPDTFISLPGDESSRAYRPKHGRERSYDRERERGYGYEKRDRERHRERERNDEFGGRERVRDRDRLYEDEDSYEGYPKPRTHRSKSHNISPSPAKHPPPATRSYTMPLKPTNTRRPSTNPNDVYQYGSASAQHSQQQVYTGSAYDLNNQNHNSSRQGSKYNLPATAPAKTSRHHNPRSASTNDVSAVTGVNGKYSSAAVHDQNKYYSSRTSFDHPHTAPAPSGYTNGHLQPASATLPRAKPTRTHTSSANNYPYANGAYASQSQAPLQQPQQQPPQRSQVYLPQKSQNHLPQPAPPPVPPVPAAAGRKAPPAPLNLPPYSAAPQGNNYPQHQYNSSKLQPFYQASGGPHSAPAPGYPAVPGASGYPTATGNGSAPNSASVGSGSASTGSYPLPPGFQAQSGPIPKSPNRVAFSPSPSPSPMTQYPVLKEKPKPLIKRILGSLTGSKASSAASSTVGGGSTIGPTPTNSPAPEYLVPGNKRGVSLDGGIRPLSAPPIRSTRSKDRDKELERDRRARGREYERERSRTANAYVDIEKVGGRWYDMSHSSLEQEKDKDWELVAKEERERGKPVRTGTLKKRPAGERADRSRRDKERAAAAGGYGGGHDRRSSH